jgi:putative transposase
MNKRNNYPPELKTRIVLEILKEEMTLAQISEKYQVHQNMLTRWRQEFIQYSQGAFQRGKTDSEKELRAEKERSQELEKLVGQLTYEVDWLKKKSAQFGIKIRKA